MAITDYATYVTELNAPLFRSFVTKNSLSTVAGRMYSLWTQTPFAANTPTTAEAPTRTTTGALPDMINGGGTALRMLGAELVRQRGGLLVLCDRLSHQGGLSATVTTAQTTNLPTAALTRYTDGVGVMMGLEIYTQIGTTATTVTASYTNQANTSGQTSVATVFGGTNNREIYRLIVLPLQQGDTGVRAVASVTVLASTGTAGDFGVTLFKPLVAIPIVEHMYPHVHDALLTLHGQFAEVVDDACLFWVTLSATTSTGILNGTFSFSED
jgi:hypothetical protein